MDLEGDGNSSEQMSISSLKHASDIINGKKNNDQ